MEINAQDALHVQDSVLVGALMVVLDVEMIAPKAVQVYAAVVALLHVVVLVLAHAQAVLLLVVFPAMQIAGQVVLVIVAVVAQLPVVVAAHD